MKCNDIFEKYSRRSAELKVGILPNQDETPYMLIEGTARGLKMLAELLVATADRKEPCKIQIGPLGAGNYHFSKQATHGIYLHRVPCKDGEVEIEPQMRKKRSRRKPKV